jgi:hypothetical protein
VSRATFPDRWLTAKTSPSVVDTNQCCGPMAKSRDLRVGSLLGDRYPGGPVHCERDDVGARDEPNAGRVTLGVTAATNVEGDVVGRRIEAVG